MFNLQYHFSIFFLKFQSIILNLFYFFIYKGKNYHQGTSYVNVRFANDLFCTWILSKLGAKSLFVPEQQYVMYDFIYRRRPDGLVLPSGDENHIRSGWKSYALPNMLASSYYGDSYLAYEFERKQGLEPHCLIFALLWRDFELKATPPGRGQRHSGNEDK